ncbi:DUF6069 family protein [Streptomyces cuspidosporus]|uniref:Uncharacterized protein n=1 Tax=Streptomyces cuspidosporus TaxID=66882 RepID=A0ABP5UH87_9ACTN
MSATPAAGTGGTVRTRAIALAGAVVLAALIWLLAHEAFGVDLRTPDGPGATTTSELPFAAVPLSVLVVSLLGWALLALLERFTARARTVWTAVAGAVLVMSLFAPVFSEGLTGGNRLTLVCLHLAVGAVLIPAYRKGARQA